MKKTNQRWFFKIVIYDDLESHWKLGEDPADALFRFQIEAMRKAINSKVFQVKKVGKLQKKVN